MINALITLFGRDALYDVCMLVNLGFKHTRRHTHTHLVREERTLRGPEEDPGAQLRTSEYHFHLITSVFTRWTLEINSSERVTRGLLQFVPLICRVFQIFSCSQHGRALLEAPLHEPLVIPSLAAQSPLIPSSGFPLFFWESICFILDPSCLPLLPNIKELP